jgi:Zn-dependent protease
MTQPAVPWVQMSAPPHEPEPRNELWGSVFEPRPEAPGPPPRQGFLRRLFAPIIGLLALIGSKASLILAALTKLKFAGTFLSMVVSVGAYTLLWGWKFAVLFVLLLFVHELGHALQLRAEGVKAGLPVFIPFLGALIAMKEMPRNAWIEAKVGLAGPILGTAGAAAVWIAGEATDSDLLRAAAYTAFLLNLFNLIPITPLDGGRAVAALHPALWIGGLAALVGIMVLHPSPFLLLILVLGGLDAWRRWRGRFGGGAEARAYYAVLPWQRAAVLVTYVGLIGALVVAMHAAYVPH